MAASRSLPRPWHVGGKIKTCHVDHRVESDGAGMCADGFHFASSVPSSPPRCCGWAPLVGPGGDVSGADSQLRGPPPTLLFSNIANRSVWRPPAAACGAPAIERGRHCRFAIIRWRVGRAVSRPRGFRRRLPGTLCERSDVELSARPAHRPAPRLPFLSLLTRACSPRSTSRHGEDSTCDPRSGQHFASAPRTSMGPARWPGQPGDDGSLAFGRLLGGRVATLAAKRWPRAEAPTTQRQKLQRKLKRRKERRCERASA